ncbi:hypothetical protein E8E13_003467 [Curvularia kusanoi]|uniref:Uncharacterized protein n=1 Tax=Curvularia kusanoi TaxID=90978 RepID=A0A9P4W7S5_CURKU|nr:hypothetical protein E8E13_003467 [Curvularia kusanoi]
MEHTQAASLERPLRLLTYLTTAIALPLNIAATIISIENQYYRRWGMRHVTAYCFIFIPLALTVVTSSASLICMRKQGKGPRTWHFRALDLAAVCAYFAVLVPCWALEIREFNTGGFGLLTGYLTAPMIINMFIHMYFLFKDLKFRSTVDALLGNPRCQQCPNCQAKFTTGTSQVVTSKGYSLLRGEDYLDVEADPIQYRDSEDFLGEGAERAERGESTFHTEQPEQAKAAENSGERKEMMDV